MEIEREIVCWNCNKEFVAKGEGDMCRCPHCRQKCYVELQRVVKCFKCGNEFIARGERSGYVVCDCGTYIMMPEGNDSVRREMAIDVTCLQCGKQFKTGASYEYTYCTHCGAYKQLKFNYRHFANRKSSSSSGWGGGIETDYFDSDMEGAPGFNGW